MPSYFYTIPKLGTNKATSRKPSENILYLFSVPSPREPRPVCNIYRSPVYSVDKLALLPVEISVF